jgi:hypothetical protein
LTCQEGEEEKKLPLKKIKKTLDKYMKVWYNKHTVKREREQK